MNWDFLVTYAATAVLVFATSFMWGIYLFH